MDGEQGEDGLQGLPAASTCTASAEGSAGAHPLPHSPGTQAMLPTTCASTCGNVTVCCAIRCSIFAAISTASHIARTSTSRPQEWRSRPHCRCECVVQQC